MFLSMRLQTGVFLPNPVCMACLSFDVKEFDLKDERRIRRNDIASTALTVGELGWNRQNRLAADHQMLQAFRPARDDLIESEVNRLATLDG